MQGIALRSRIEQQELYPRVLTSKCWLRRMLCLLPRAHECFEISLIPSPFTAS